MKFTKTLALAILAIAITSAPILAASSDPAVMATVQQFINGFNRGDTKAMLATCATEASVIDDFPPHEWQGAAACADWYAAYTANNEREGITNGFVTVGKPWYQSVSGNRAYIVLPATFAFKQRGKPVTEGNAVFTLALRKSAASWRITGWAWSDH